MTKRESQIYAVILDYVAAKGYPPSVREIGDLVGLSSSSTVHRYLQPKRFRWLGRWHRILKCTTHEVEQHWWSKLREPEPVRYRCETYQGMVCDLCFIVETGTERWVLERVWD